MDTTFKTAIFYGTIMAAALVGILFSSRAVTTLSENPRDFRRHCIVIDPGHGGEDGGAVSISGIPESEYNLNISRKLNDLLNLLGYRTKMIRNSDISVYTSGNTLSEKKISDLKERVKLANETEGSILLSIHQNFYNDGRYSGPQVFYANTAGSEQLAKDIQSAFIVSLQPENKRQSKPSHGVYLMEHIQCPGILIECGFLSNSREETLLKAPAYQQKLCSVIAVSVSRYLSNT